MKSAFTSSLIFGLVVAALGLTAGLWNKTDLSIGYLSAIVFWLQISLGAFGLLCIHNITGGRWGRLIQPFMLWSTQTLWILAALFVPVLIFVSLIYPWADLARAMADSHLQKRLGFMNQGFFSVRTVVYFGIWIAFTYKIRKTMSSGKKLKAPTPKLKLWSGLALMTLLFTVSLALIDWVMSVDPEWSSTGFGAVTIAGCLTTGIAFAILATVYKERRLAIQDKANPLLIDLGNLLLMSVMLWAYLEFTQYLIIWSGQLPREMHWYQARSSSAWLSAIAVIFILHFVVPFSALIFRSVKRSPKAMATLSLLVLFSQWVECSIWTAPSAGVPFGSAISTSIVCNFVIGSCWLLSMLRESKREPAATFRDLELELSV